MASPQVSPRLHPVIRVFVSSTFSDLKHERNALQREVFPRLEAYCQRYGFQFQAIDLRWGVPSEAGLDHRTMQICFDELRRSQEISPQPNFLILLGDRYGWRPLPEEISTAEFEQLAQAAAAEPASLPILEQWYRRDDNAVPPVHVLRSRRDSPDGRNYGRTDDGKHDQPAWREVQAVLWSVINRAFPPEQLDRRFDPDNLAASSIPSIVRFQASATEQEIWNGALQVLDADQHVFAFVRRIENIKESLAEARPKTSLSDFVDLRADDHRDVIAEGAQQQLLAELQCRLASENASLSSNYREMTVTARLKFDDATQRFDVSTDHVQSLCDAVYDRLIEVVKWQIDDYWRESQRDSIQTADQTESTTQTISRIERELELEVEAHDRFGAERAPANTFVGRVAETECILDYLRGTERRPLVIYGPSGTGKTALLAHAAHRAEQELGRKPIVRFLGTTPHSGTVRSLLTSLCRQLRRDFKVKGEPPTDFRDLVDDFAKLLADHSSQPIYIFLDALDQLDDTDNGRQLAWLRYSQNQPLVENFKLVVSCLSEVPAAEPSGQPLRVLEQRQLTTGCVVINELTRDEASTLLFDRWLRRESGSNITPSPHGRPRRTIASNQQRDYLEQCIRQATEHTECRRPLYLKLLYEEARLWRSFDRVPIAIPETAADLLRGMFRRLRQPDHHGPLVNSVIGYLAASRYGLAENELLEILFADPDYKAILDRTNERLGHEFPLGAHRIPIALWARLRYDLQALLTERESTGETVLQFYHRQVSEYLCRTLYSRIPKWERQYHQRLADYFRTLADPTGNSRWPAHHIRPYRELAFHIAQHDTASLITLLSDPLYLDARCRMNDVHSLLGDFEPLGIFATHLTSTLRSTLTRFSSSLYRYPLSLLSLLDAQTDSPDHLSEHNATRAQAAGRSWLRVRSVSLKAPDQPSGSRRFKIAKHIDFPPSRKAAFSSRGTHVVLITRVGRLGIFEIASGVLSEIDATLPRAEVEHLSFSNETDHICAVFSDGTLHFISTNTTADGLTRPIKQSTHHCYVPDDLPMHVAWIHDGIVWQSAESQLAIVRIAAGSLVTPPTLVDIPSGSLRGACKFGGKTLVFVRTETGDVAIPFPDSDRGAANWTLNGAMIDLCALPNDRLAIAFSDGNLRLYDASEWPLCKQSTQLAQTPNRLAYVDGVVLVQADDRTVFRWDFSVDDSACRYDPPSMASTILADGPFVALAKSQFAALEGGQVIVGELTDSLSGRLIAIDDSPAGLLSLSSGSDQRGQFASETWTAEFPPLVPVNDTRICLSAHGKALGVPSYGGWVLTDNDHVCRLISPIVLERITSIRNDHLSGFWIATESGGVCHLSEELDAQVTARIRHGATGDVIPSAKHLIWYGSVYRKTNASFDYLSGIVVFEREAAGLRQLGERCFPTGQIYTADYHEESGTFIVLFEKHILVGSINEFLHSRERSIPLAYFARDAVILSDGEHALYTTVDGAVIAIHLRSAKCVSMLALHGSTRHFARSHRPRIDAIVLLDDRQILGLRLCLPQRT